jgi:nitrate reductase gamma subunit
VASLLWLADVLFGTSFLAADPLSVSAAADDHAHETLMWDFVAATGTGLLAGLVFEFYFRRLARSRERLPSVPALEDVFAEGDSLEEGGEGS